ncbi:MAG: hypothetical protein KDK78_01435 [Chlamydiia bacterium]|nr:hypothetical protein [Chlamydiia bacterium]
MFIPPPGSHSYRNQTSAHAEQAAYNALKEKVRTSLNALGERILGCGNSDMSRLTFQAKGVSKEHVDEFSTFLREDLGFAVTIQSPNDPRFTAIKLQNPGGEPQAFDGPDGWETIYTIRQKECEILHIQVQKELMIVGQQWQLQPDQPAELFFDLRKPFRARCYHQVKAVLIAQGCRVEEQPLTASGMNTVRLRISR